MAGVTPHAATATPADPGEHLFETVLVESQRGPRAGWQRWGGRVSVALHVLALASLVFVPIFTPAEMPGSPDVIASLIYDPPPPPPPPLPRGSALQPQQAKPEVPKPVVEHPVQQPLTAPIEVVPKETDKITPEPGVKPQDQFGSETGSDLGDALGQDGGVDGGQVGGVTGGVLGGVVGGTGTGPVMDPDMLPVLLKQPKPVYPHEAFVKKIEGTVVLQIFIDARGQVTQAVVLRSIPLLDEAAKQCVYQWFFQPAVKHGRPVPTIAQAPVSFRIF